MNVQREDTSRSPDQLLELLRERRQDLFEILITAVIFGLTMNLISDVISTFLTDYALILTLLSILTTIGLLWYIIRRQIGRYAKHTTDIKLAIVWNSEKGEILSRETGYLPQLIDHTLFSQMEPKQKKKFSSMLKCESDVDSTRDVSRHLFEGVFFTLLERMSSIDQEMDSITIDSCIPSESLLLLPNQSIRMPIFGKESVKYRRKSKESGVFRIDWGMGLLTRIEIKYEIGKIDFFEDRLDTDLAKVDSFYLHDFAGVVAKITKGIQKSVPEIYGDRELDLEIPKRTGPIVRVDIDVNVKMGFSSVWYQFAPSRINKIWRWGLSFIEALQSTLDWDVYRSTIIGFEAGKEWLNQSRFRRNTDDYYYGSGRAWYYGLKWKICSGDLSETMYHSV